MEQIHLNILALIVEGIVIKRTRLRVKEICVLVPQIPVYVTLCILFNLSFPIYKMEVITAPPRAVVMNKQNNADKALSTVLSCHKVSTQSTSDYYHQSWNLCLSILMIFFLSVA